MATSCLLISHPSQQACVRVWSSTTAINLDRGNVSLCVGLSAAVSFLPSVDAPRVISVHVSVVRPLSLEKPRSHHPLISDLTLYLMQWWLCWKLEFASSSVESDLDTNQDFTSWWRHCMIFGETHVSLSLLNPLAAVWGVLWYWWISSALAFGINGGSLNMRVLFLLGTGRGSHEIFYLC